MASYVFQQGFGQLAMFTRREPIAHALQDPSLSTQACDRLELVWYARRYGVERVGLRDNGSYRDVVWLDRDAASYAVSASPRNRLSPYRWCFPVAGCLPYIGYFNPADARREAERLRAQGLDAHVRGVQAYSLGGWFPDPVYSPMLEDSRGTLANTVLHEMLHGTVFVAGQASFNEGLATFVGDHAELDFLTERFGARSPTVRDARAELADQRRYVREILALLESLRGLYARRLPLEEVLRERERLFDATRDRLNAASWESRAFAPLRRRRVTLNNAVLVNFRTYFSGEARYERALERFHGDLRAMVGFMRERVQQERDPEAWIDRWLERPGGGGG